MGYKITLVKNIGPPLLPYPVWIFNNGPINGEAYLEGRSMPFNPVERSDYGTYTCHYYDLKILPVVTFKPYIALVELKVLGMF